MSWSSGPPSKRGRLEMYSPYQPMQPGQVQQELQRINPHLKENKIVLLTVLNAIYPVNVELVHKICRPIAEPLRIVIFQKIFLQVMIEFADVETATRVKDELHSCDIYPGSCTLKAEFAKAEKLNVKKNDSMTWDFTNKNSAPKEEVHGASSERKVLISQPPPLDGPAAAAPGRGALFQEPTAPGGMGANGANANPNFGSMNHSYMSYMGMSGGGTSSYGGAGGNQGGGGGDSRSGGGSSGGGGSYDWGGGYQGGAGGYQGGSVSVLMVYGMDDRFNCSGVFNLLCLYGNVLKVSFMRNKPGCAIVEMSDPCSADRVMQNLRNAVIFGKRLSIERSRKPFVEEIRNPHELYDGSPSFVNFSDSNNHRFDTAEKAMKNRIVAPSAVLHFFNVPKMTDDELSTLFEKAQAPCPSSIKWFEQKANAKTLTGLLRFDSIAEACEAMVLVNHAATNKGYGPNQIKLCFSNSKSRDS